MAKQLSFLNQKQDSPIVDCLRYEETLDLWRTALPTDNDIDWCAEHVKNCRTTAHALKSPEAERSPVLSEFSALGEVLDTPDEEVDPDRESSRVHETAQRARNLLEHSGAIERGAFDYGLPCGRHSDTHINVAKLCWSDSGMAQAAELIWDVLRGLQFDTLVSTCWPMAAISRRIQRAAHHRLHHVVAEGYSPTLLGPIHPGSQVVILTDVAVTGQLIRRIQAEVHQREGRVVKSVALAAPMASDSPLHSTVEALCHIPMALEAPHVCPRCGRLPLKEFNPLASQMTLRKQSPRSTAQFLAENKEAAEFWQIVERTGAYERHHREGHRHYVAFVDTLKLLSDPIGERIVWRLWQRVSRRMPAPDIVLTANRARARLLGTKLIQAIKLGRPGINPELVLTSGRGRNRVAPPTTMFGGRKVLVVDAAADHGETLDELSLLASDAGATQVGAAVLLSRLREGAEEALEARLDAGFTRLYALPIPGSRSSCAICDRHESWRESAYQLPPGQARELVLRLTRRAIRRSHEPASPTSQLELFPDDQIPPEHLLSRCHRRVAGGIALHALHTAQGDGMAPLTVPELFDERIPINNRIGLIEALPTGILERTGSSLKQELEKYLRAGDEARLWVVVADVFVREGCVEWVDGLRHVIRRQVAWTSNERFWTRLSAISLQGRHNLQFETQARLEDLVQEFAATPIASKLRELRTIAQP